VPAHRVFAFVEDTTGLRRTGRTYLVDEDGRVRGRDVADEWRMSWPDAPGTYRDDRGVRVLGAWAPVGDWKVVAQMDETEVMGSLQTLGLVLLGLGGLFFVLAAGALAYIGRKTQHSFDDLTESIRRAARGEFGGRVEDHVFPEIGEVTDAINDMHRRLASRDAEILKQRQELFCQRCELERLNVEIVQADRLKSEFVANMSHEVRTPLHSILTLAGVLLRETSGGLNPEQRKQVAIIERSGQALLAMLGDILDFSKIEAGRVTVTPSEVAPGALAAGVREAVAAQAAEKGLDLVLDAPEGLAPIRTDPEKAHRVLLNLAHNAVKFTDRGSVTLRARARPDGAAMFEVADTGPGIPKDQLETVFEPFQQADGTAKRAAGGTGLGLSIARDLAKLLGGRIGVESEPGRGTTFEVVFPRAIPPRAPGAPRPVTGASDVLVVGATPPSGDAVRNELAVAGFAAGRAVCGRDVRSAVERTGVGAILLDLGIFAHEGVDVFSGLAPRLAGNGVPVFAYWMEAEKRRGRFCGAARFEEREGDGYRLACESAAPLPLPERVGDGDRRAASEWTRTLRDGPSSPLHEVVRALVTRLDDALHERPGAAEEVLLLDPDDDSRYSTAMQLEQMGYRVRAAPDVAAAPGDCRPSVIVTASRGLEAVRERFDARVVVLTADARAATHEAARNAGADAVLVKPVPATKLLRALVECGRVKA